MKMCGVMLMVIVAGMVVIEARQYEVNEYDAPVEPIVQGSLYVDQLESQLTPLLLEERQHLDQRLTQLTDKGGEINQRLKQMEARLEGKLKTFLAEKVNYLQTKMREGLERMLVEIIGMETRVEEGLEETETNIEEVMVAITNQLARLASHEELVQMKAKLSTVIISTIGQVITTMEDLVTVDKLEEVLVAELEVVGEGCSRCGQQDTLAQVSAAVTNVQNHFSLLGQQLNTTLSSCSQGCETIGQEVNRLGDDRCSAASTLTQNMERLEVDVGNIHIFLDDIYNFTKPTPEPTITTTTTTPPPQVTQVPVRPKTLCEDSTFVASKFNVCAAAVRFRKCNLLALSYHCCHTCYTAGHLPEDGPWRYLNYPRQINPLQAFQLLRRP